MPALFPLSISLTGTQICHSDTGTAEADPSPHPILTRAVLARVHSPTNPCTQLTAAVGILDSAPSHRCTYPPCTPEANCLRTHARLLPAAARAPSRYPKPQAHPLHGPLGGGHYTKPSRRTTRTSSTSNKGSTQAWGPAEHSASHGGIDHGTGGTVQGPALCAPGAPQGALKTPGKHKRHNSRGGALGKRVQPHVQLVVGGVWGRWMAAHARGQDCLESWEPMGCAI